MSEIPGYRVPVHRAVLTPSLLLGVPRRFAILNASLFAALVLGLQVWWAVAPGLLIHLAAARYSRQDPWFFEITLRHLRQRAWYRR